MADSDCDDYDATVYDGAPELCDLIDNDCDTEVDEGIATTPWYTDGDGDGFGTGDALDACTQPAGRVAADCADDNPSVHPDAVEECDGIDNDCNGQIDEAGASPGTWYTDGDGDGFGTGAGVEACSQPAGTSADNTDCDDALASGYPGALEECNGVDDDCDGSVDDGAIDGVDYYLDRDTDGWGAGAAIASCGQPAGTVTVDGDGDDTRSTVNPDGVEVCNSIDDDCNGSVDDAATDMTDWYDDGDGHSYGAGAPTAACSTPSGWVSDDSDCDDTRASVYPGATETCNDLDDDCDGTVDDNAVDAYTLYPDDDGDSFGDTSGAILSCDPTSGYTTVTGDCDDAVAAVNPDATEVCNGIDDDCDGSADGPDAADAVTVWPDTDRDGYGAGRSSITCSVTAGFATNDDDCDDSVRAVNPGADEECDGVDNDCDTFIDEDDAVDATWLYADADGDGLGDPDDYDLRCDGSTNGLDCNDSDDTEPQVVDASSASSAPDGSLSDPWESIQDGIDQADECVIVADGVYIENLDFLGKNILVRSIDGATNTVVDGGSGEAVVSFSNGEGPGAELRGFTLTNGHGFYEESSTSTSCGSSTVCTSYYITTCGGGIYVNGSEPTLSDLIVLGNNLTVPADYTSGTDSYYYFSFGGGLCVQNATLTISDVDFWENYALDGGAAYVDSTADLTVQQSAVYANSAEFGGAFEVDGGRLDLANVLLAWNQASDSGGGVYVVDGIFTGTNITIGECDAATGAGVYGTGTTTLSLLNSIVYGADTGVGVLVGSGASYTGSYSDVYGNTGRNYSGVTDPTGTSGNISSTPSFMSVSADGDYTNDDWTLASGSACINRGNPSAAYYDADGTRNDMGAFGGPNGSWP